MAATSYNGWPVIERAGCRTIHVPGSDVRFAVVDDDDVAVIFQAVAAWIDRRVEDIDTRAGVRGYDVPDDWGHAKRPTRGSTTWSCHASGTAIDVNAVQHARGARGTWTTAERVKVHAFLARLGGAVRWGEDYRSPSTIDGMHFEINTTSRAVLSRAAATARAVLAELFPPAPTVQEDEDMPTAQEIAAALVNYPLPLGPANTRLNGGRPTITVGEALVGARFQAQAAAGGVTALGPALEAVAAASGPGAGMAELVAAAREGAALGSADALGGITFTAQPTDGHASTAPKA